MVLVGGVLRKFWVMNFGFFERVLGCGRVVWLEESMTGLGEGCWMGGCTMWYAGLEVL